MIQSDSYLVESSQQQLVDAHFRAHVGQWRDVYNEAFVEGAIYRKRQEIVLRWIDELAMPTGEQVLEIGCGAGRCTVALAQRGYLVQAMDSVPGMLDTAQQFAIQAGLESSISIGLGDAHDLAFRDGRFGAVLAIGVVPYLYSPEKALKEMARVLKPGGFLLVTAGNRWRLNHLLDPLLSPPVQPAKRVLAAILHRFRKPRPERPCPPLRLDSPGELRHWLYSVGLVKLKSTTVGFPPLTFQDQPIFGERTSFRLNNWLQALADRSVPAIRSSGMDYIVLAKKE